MTGAMTAKDFQSRAFNKHVKGDLQGAIADYDQAIQLDPNNASAYNSRGILCTQSGNHQGAILNLQRAAELYQQQGDLAAHKKVLHYLKGLHA